MELILFKNDRDYIRAQRKSRSRKGEGPFTHPNEFRRIRAYTNDLFHPTDPIDVLCHGAYNGQELEEFQKIYPNGNVIGTDLFPGSDGVIEHDFREVNSDWESRFHVIYSNSLDHADDPEQCLGVWMDQLISGGILFLQWSQAHIGVKDGDCFGAHLHEYLILADRVGYERDRGVTDLLYCGDCVVLIVVG